MSDLLFDDLFVSLREDGDVADNAEDTALASRRRCALEQWVRIRADIDLDQANSKLSWRNGAWRFFCRHFINDIPRFLHVDRSETLALEPLLLPSRMPGPDSDHPLLDALFQRGWD